MPSCVFRYCTNYYAKVKKIQGVTYHMFPSDEIRLQDWIAIVREQRSEYDWTPSKSSRICSDHFKPCDKHVSKEGRTLINKDSVPYIEERKYNYGQNSPSSLDNVSLPEFEEIIESPKEAALRRRVHKLTLAKNQLRKRNKNLIQQNVRLKKRIARFAVMLKELKKKDCTPKEQFSQLIIKTEVIAPVRSELDTSLPNPPVLSNLCKNTSILGL